MSNSPLGVQRRAPLSFFGHPVALMGVCLFGLVACQSAPATATPTPPATPVETTTPAQAVEPTVKPAQSPVIGMANPASVHCEKAGGTLELKNGKNGTYGICHLPDGSMCEEWSFFRTGKCTADSLKKK